MDDSDTEGYYKLNKQ